MSPILPNVLLLANDRGDAFRRLGRSRPRRRPTARPQRLRTPMLDEIKSKIADEVEALTRELNVDLPRRIEKAVELGDLRENAEYKSALERQQFVQARLGHLARRMSDLSKIDVDDMPVDRVGFGSKITVRDLTRDRVVDYTIVAGDYMDLEAGHISMASPIGKGLMGARKGEEVTVRLPGGERRFKVTRLSTLPEQTNAKKQA